MDTNAKTIQPDVQAESTLSASTKTPALNAPSTLKINFSNLKTVSVKNAAAKRGGGGGRKDVSTFSIVNNVNGHRVSFSERLYNDIDAPKSFQFALNDTSLYIGKVIPDCGGDERFKIKASRNCYNRALVECLTEEFNLDFSKVTSISFRDIDVLTEEHDGKEVKIAKINMTNGTTAGYEYDDSDED